MSYFAPCQEFPRPTPPGGTLNVPGPDKELGDTASAVSCHHCGLERDSLGACRAILGSVSVESWLNSIPEQP